MGIEVSITLFFIVAVLYIVIIDIFTIFFRITGMSREKAKFQVISLLTNSGYTTKESEAVTEVWSRRKMAQMVMLFGYIFSITILSAFINLVFSLPSYAAHEVLPALLVVCSIFIAFIVIKNIPAVKDFFSIKLEGWGKKLIRGVHGNRLVYLDEFKKGALVKVEIKEVPEALAAKTLGEAGLWEKQGIYILFIEDRYEVRVEAKKDTVLENGYSLVAFGPFKNIKKTFAPNR